MFNQFQYSHLTLLHPKKRWICASILSRDFLWRHNALFPGKMIKITTNNIICDNVAILIVQNWNNTRETHCYARETHCHARETPGELATITAKHSWGHVRALWRHRIIRGWGKADLILYFHTTDIPDFEFKLKYEIIDESTQFFCCGKRSYSSCIRNKFEKDFTTFRHGL